MSPGPSRVSPSARAGPDRQAAASLRRRVAALTCGWVRKRAVERSTPRRSASRRSAPSRSASSSRASRRSARIRSAPRREQPRRSPVTRRPTRSSYDRSAASGQRRRMRVLASARSCPTRSRRPSTSVVSRVVGIGIGQCLDLEAHRSPVRVGSAALHLEQVHEHLVELAHDRQDGAHLGEVVAVAPGDAGVRHLRDLLSGTEALEDGAPRPTVLAQCGVDAATVVVEQVEAGPPARLVDAEAGGGREGEEHAAQPEAARAVRPQPRCRHRGIVSCTGVRDVRRTSGSGWRTRSRRSGR